MSHVDTTSPITHVSLCAGYAGIDLGLKRAIPSLRTIAFSEIEAFACANLVSKMEAGLLDPAPIWTDLKTFPWAEFHGCVDILSGGYPCQPFSAAGKRLGAEDPRHLWPFIAAGIALMRPGVCFFENVEGHISLGLPDVLQDLAGMGYRTTWCVASASECGAPHQRKRIFILAHANGSGDAQSRLQLADLLAESGAAELADSLCQRSASGLSRSLAGHEGFAGIADDCGDLAWPSRPGEQQFAWEPPRVVADTKGNQRRLSSDSQSTAERWWSAKLGSADGVGAAEAMDDASRLRSAEPADGSGQAAPWADASSDQAMGNAQCLRPQGRHDTGGLQAMGVSRAELAGDGCGPMGHANSARPQVRPRQRGSAIQGANADGGEAAQRQTQPSLGGDPDGLTHRLDHAVLHVTTDNRTDELRLLGNGVVPATAERAFRVLVGELMEEAP